MEELWQKILKFDGIFSPMLCSRHSWPPSSCLPHSLNGSHVGRKHKQPPWTSMTGGMGGSGSDCRLVPSHHRTPCPHTRCPTIVGPPSLSPLPPLPSAAASQRKILNDLIKTLEPTILPHIDTFLWVGQYPHKFYIHIIISIND